MEVVLLERVEKLGQMGEVVKVKAGYARNFLLPQKKALRASKENLEHFKGQRIQLEAVNLVRRTEAEVVAEKMNKLVVVVVRQAGEAGHLYGSVAARDIADAIKENGYTVGRSQVQLNQPIKSLGSHQVRVVLHPEVTVTIGVTVARSLDEAKAKAAIELQDSPEEEEEAEAEVVETEEEAEV